MSKFLHWNCRGYYPNFEELGRLISLHAPKAICLQELQLCHRPFLPPSRYRLPLLSVNRGPNDRGGAAILFHESVPFTHIPITTHLHVVAARVHLHSTFTLCSVYLAPSCGYTKEDLFSLFRSLPAPLLVLGDFNIRHPLWGDSVSSHNADWLLSALQEFSLGCLNSGLPTFERFDTCSSSCVDLSLCSLSLIDGFWWDRSSYLHGSDHYPIVVTSLSPDLPQTPYTSWRYDRADWSSFREATYVPYLPGTDVFASAEDAFNYFRDIVLGAAGGHIPRSSASRRSATPWWNAVCARANRIKRQLYRSYKSVPTQANLILFKAAAARSRCVNRRTRKQFFRSYASTVTSSTPLSSIYGVIRRISRGHCRSLAMGPTRMMFSPLLE